MLDKALVIAISQSGQSPDIVSVVQEGQRQGCTTLAITNKPDSPLGKHSDFVLDINSGNEISVAATKTYTCELLSIAMLSAALAPEKTSWTALGRVPSWAEEILNLDKHIRRTAERFRFMRQCVVLGRGYNYCTAFEWALKLKELAYIISAPYSSADFQHGPIALIDRGFPVLAISPNGQVFDNMLYLLDKLRNEHKAEIILISNNQSALTLAQSTISIPSAIPEWLTPIISIIPAQLFAFHLTSIKGINPENHDR